MCKKIDPAPSTLEASTPEASALEASALAPSHRLPGPLTPGRLLRRYKRFLADVALADGAVVTAHIANPGSMMGLSEPGTEVWLSQSADPKRKLAYSWELVSLPGGGWSGVSTAHPNRIVEAALRAGCVAEAAEYRRIRREVRFGADSRVDFLLEAPDRPPLYLEVKNVHLRRRGDRAEFPDAVTARGLKHLRELAAVACAGARAAMLYLLQRDDVARLGFAADIDPAYAAGVAAARAAGVELWAYGCRFETERRADGLHAAIALDRRRPIVDVDA